MKKIFIIFTSCALVLIFTLNISAQAFECEILPRFIGYSTRDGAYYPKSWSGSLTTLNVSNDDVSTNPATFFTSYTFDPWLEPGYALQLSISWYVTYNSSESDFVDGKQHIYSVLFRSYDFNDYYEFPEDNIVVKSYVYQNDSKNRTDYDLDIYLYYDENVNQSALDNMDNLTIEFLNEYPNSTQFKFKSAYISSKSSYTTSEFQSFVADSLSQSNTLLMGLGDEVQMGTEKTVTAIDNMPANEYDWINGEFGKQAETPAAEFLDDQVNNFLSPIVDKISPSLSALYDSVSSHEASFSIIMPDTTVPFFDNLKIYETTGRVYLYDFLTPDTTEKFDQILPVVRGFTSISAIFGLIYWCLPKNFLGDNNNE